MDSTKTQLSLLNGNHIDVPYSHIKEVIINAVAMAPNQKLVFFDGNNEEILTYSDMLAEAQMLLRYLNASGINKSDYIILHLNDHKAMVMAFWACFLGDILPTTSTIPDHYSEKNIEILKLRNTLAVLKRAPVLVNLCNQKLLEDALDKNKPNIIPWELYSSIKQEKTAEINVRATEVNENAFLFQTSGTTGKAKMVQITHGAILSNIMSSAHLLKLTEQDVSVNWTPLTHVGGLVMFHLRDLYIRSKQVFINTKKVIKDPIFWFQSLNRFQATITWGAQSVYDRVNEYIKQYPNNGLDLSRVRYLINGGDMVIAPKFKDLITRCNKYGLKDDVAVIAWGMTETAGVATMYLASKKKGSRTKTASSVQMIMPVGTPLSNMAIKIVDRDGETLPQGEQGLLKVKGQQVTPGYYQQYDANDACFDEKGWFDTGDFAMISNENLYILGRQKDIIIRNGLNYYSSEIEEGVSKFFNIPIEEVVVTAFRLTNDQSDQVAIFYRPNKSMLHNNFASFLYTHFGFGQITWVKMPSSEFPKNELQKVQRAKLRLYLEKNYSKIDLTVQNAG